MSTRYEYYRGSYDDRVWIYGAVWHGQTFTPSINHKVTSVKLLLGRTGSPGTLTVSIRATDGSGHPTGGDLCSGTYNGNGVIGTPNVAWIEIFLGSGAQLSAGTKYAIVARCTSGDYSNRLEWQRDHTAPTYSGGCRESSTNSGSSWSSSTTHDNHFEEWGDLTIVLPTVQTNDATQITGDSAKLNGYLASDGGEACSVRFQWGLTASYGNNTAWQAGFNSYDSFETIISSLLNDTTYHFRAQANNTQGTASGADKEFTTLAAPPASATPHILALARSELLWLFRLKPGSGTYSASKLSTSCPYSMALACDDTHIWATQAGEVWRSPLPSVWTPPTPGSGAGSKITLPVKHIVKLDQNIDPRRQSHLEVELDNAKGDYASPGAGDIAEIKRGSRVNLHIGYRTTTDETEEVGRYFIESWHYARAPRRASLTLNCIDAWSLLQRFAFNKPVEWNLAADDYTVYELIELVLQGIGATLEYKSKSALIDSLYPRLDIHAGETGANVIARLLRLVSDVLFFFGLTGYIVYPQAADSADYSYIFPEPI